MAGRVWLHTGAVHCYDRQTIGNGMPSLDQLPCLALLCLLPVRVCGDAADSGGVDKHLRSTKGHGTGGLRIPLIPAYKHSKGTHGCFYGLEAKVSGGEVEFLIEEGIVRNMHLAVGAGNASVLLQDYCGVVVDAGGAALEKGQHQNYSKLTGQCTETLGGRPGDGLCKVTELCVLLLAEIEAVVKFLKYHKLCAFGCAGADPFLKPGYVPGNVCGAVLLHHANF